MRMMYYSVNDTGILGKKYSITFISIAQVPVMFYRCHQRYKGRTENDRVDILKLESISILAIPSHIFSPQFYTHQKIQFLQNWATMDNIPLLREMQFLLEIGRVHYWIWRENVSTWPGNEAIKNCVRTVGVVKCRSSRVALKSLQWSVVSESNRVWNFTKRKV